MDGEEFQSGGTVGSIEAQHNFLGWFDAPQVSRAVRETVHFAQLQTAELVRLQVGE